METWKPFILLIGRVILVVIFLISGIGKIENFSGTEQYMAQHGMPFAPLFLAGAIICEIAGSVSVIFGYFTRLGALILMIFLIPTTIIFHGNISDPMQKIHFMKNVSMFGGLLVLFASGAGRYSMDYFFREKRRGFM